jgi:four helix bundle protein
VSDVRTFKDLAVWNASVGLVAASYRLSEHLPRNELFGLITQIRRAAVSIPANIAEGNSRLSTAAYVHHVDIALGSHGELRALIAVACRLGFITATHEADIAEDMIKVGRLLSGLRSALKRRIASQHA